MADVLAAADVRRPVPVSPLFLTVLVIAACGLIYELGAGALASYVLGDSVLQFSTVIGAYLSALGIGAWLSRFVDRDLARRFVEVELAVALVGGFSVPVLFLAFGHLAFFRVVLYSVVIAVGTLVGLEIPLLMRILAGRIELRELVARVLSVDYAGALFASVLFPVFCVPQLGLTRTSLAFGMLNAGVGYWSTFILRDDLERVSRLRARAFVVLVLLLAAFVGADRLTQWAEAGMFSDEIVFAKQSAYQRIVVTRGPAGFQLFLDGNLQFASADEYRYHEALVHPAFAVTDQHQRVLVLGGGDGLALREILKYRGVSHVTLVDLDPAMTELAREFAPLRTLNHDAYADARVKVVHADAMRWLAEHDAGDLYDVVIVDFPDPNNFSLGKLYTTRMYRLIGRRLQPWGVVVVQSTSPLFARRSFWCVAHTVENSGFQVRPYHAYVPSFGEWGFVLAKLTPFAVPRATPPESRFLDSASMAALFVLPSDIHRVPVEENRLDNQILIQYYADEWKKWN